MTSIESDAGGSRVTQAQSGGFLSFMGAYAYDSYKRPKNTGMLVSHSVDRNMNPPEWLEEKNVTISGKKLTKDQRGPGHWENKYARELAIGDVVIANHLQETTVGARWYYRTIARYFGWMDPAKTQAQLAAEGTKAHMSTERKEAYEKRIKKEREAMTWEALIKIWVSEDSVVEASRKYRRTFDIWSLDEFLDSTPTVAWLSFKVGTFIGIVHGGMRALKAAHVEGHFMKASGIGMMALLNTSVLASVLKYAGNLTAASIGFGAGDKITTLVNTSVWPLAPGEKYHRSISNYAFGMGTAFSLVGILPWWVLNDRVLAVRMAFLGFGVGTITGIGLGYGTSRLIALNFSRVDATEQELHAYMLTTYYVRDVVDVEIARLKAEQLAHRDGK